MLNNDPATVVLQLYSLDVEFTAHGVIFCSSIDSPWSPDEDGRLEMSHVNITKKSSQVTKFLWSHYLIG